MPEPLRKAAVLSDEQAKALARIGSRIEELYQMPMDIEWALTEGQIFLRPGPPNHGTAGTPNG